MNENNEWAKSTILDCAKKYQGKNKLDTKQIIPCLELPKEKDFISLKWGLLKCWHLNSEKCQALMQQYLDLRDTGSALLQKSTPELKDLACKIIDEAEVETVLLEWDNQYVSKEAAKKYVMEYNT